MSHSARFDDLTPGAEHSFILEDPDEILVANSINEVGDLLDAVETASLRGLWSAGFVTYEAAPAFDPDLPTRPASEHLPLAWFGTFRTARSVDPVGSPPDGGEYTVSEWTPSTDSRQYFAALQRIRQEIKTGTTYQVNHTFRMTATVLGDIEALYCDLALAQRGAFSAKIETGTFTVLSASPELFFRKRGSHIETRPMKGTMPRGRWSAEDAKMAERLATSAKNRAENIMIVDLIRNDLGRVAKVGSVRVTDLFTPERFETLWQLTSRIEAEVPPDLGLRTTFEALFPSGSITGAPKQSTMSLIKTLETTPRGIYCGAIGYVAPTDVDDIHFNVAIRTIVIDDEGTASYGTGGGITWDSTAESEYAEASLKAQVLTAVSRPFALLETLRLEYGTYLFKDLHVARLTASARYLGFRCSTDEVGDSLARHSKTADAEAARIRLTLDRSGKVSVKTVEQLSEPFAHVPVDGVAEVPIAVTRLPIDETDRLRYHKTTLRSAYESARVEAPGASDVLLVNSRGHIAEATSANVAVKIGTRWFTPPLEAGCLPGIFRGVLLDGGQIEERIITHAEILHADGIALLNSVRGWRPAWIADAETERPPVLT